jgi:hypothetical protein
MLEHTSKRLSLEDSPAACWCEHEEDFHVIFWLQNQGESPERPLGATYAVVHCRTCIDLQIGARMEAARHSREILKALAPQNPAAQALLRVHATLERVQEARSAGASLDKLDALLEQLRRENEEAMQIGVLQRHESTNEM